jgi:hypothetical protein
MTIRQVVCGWEGGEPTQFASSISGSVTCTSGAARTGAYGLRLVASASAPSAFYQYAPVPLTKIVKRVYFRYESSLPGADCHIMQWSDSGTKLYRLIFRASDGAVRLEHVSGGVRDEVQDGPVMVGGTWYRLDLRINNGTTQQMEWQIDGVAKPTVGPNVNYIAGVFGWTFGTGTAQTFTLNIDDAVSLDGQNDGPDSSTVAALYPLGAGSVKRLPPTGVGTHNNSGDFATSAGTIANSWQLLDQQPMLGAADWVSQTVLNTASYLEYTHEDLGATETVIHGVRWYAGGSNDPFNQSDIKGHGIDGASDTLLWSGIPAAFSAVVVPGAVPHWPWTASEVNALKTRIGYSGDVTPNPQLRSVFIEVAIGETPPPPPADAIGTGAAGAGWRGVPDVHFEIDGVHVDVEEDWELRSSAYGGYVNGQFQIPGSQLRRHPFSIDAEAPVIAYTQVGDQIWEGKVAHVPRIGNDGLAEIETDGPWKEAEAANEVLPFQIRGGHMFVEGDEDPHNYAHNDGYEMTGRAGKLQFKAVKGEDFVSGQVASFVLWVPGAHFSRVAFVINKNRDLSNFEIRIRGGVGPSGAVTDIDNYTLSSANPSGTEKIRTGLGGDYDLIMLQIRCVTDISALAERLRAWLTSIRINDLAEDDDMSASDIVTHVGEQLGWNVAGVDSTGANVLPLLWEESWAELLLYMADLEDHYVRRVASGLQFGQWGDTEWDVLQSFSGTPELRELDPYNRVVVHYTNQAGRPAEVVIDADPDPLPNGLRVMEYTLEDPQPNDTLATAVGERLSARYSRPRWAGDIVVHKVRDHRSGPLMILPGDAARVLDWDLGKDVRLPIQGIAQRRDSVRLSIESPISLVNLMEEARRGLGHPRRGGKNRRKIAGSPF